MSDDDATAALIGGILRPSWTGDMLRAHAREQEREARIAAESGHHKIKLLLKETVASRVALTTELSIREARKWVDITGPVVLWDVLVDGRYRGHELSGPWRDRINQMDAIDRAEEMT